MPTPTTLFLEGGSGQSAPRNALFGSRIMGRLYDEVGAWMPGEQLEFVLPISLAVPSGTFPGGESIFTATTDADGKAVSEFIQADGLLGTWVGTVASVTNPAVRADFYLSNVVVPRTPTSVLITANSTQTVVYYDSFQPVTARLQDESNNGVPFAPLTMICPGGTGTFPGGSNASTVTTDAGGYATFPPFTAANFAGTFNPTISYGGVSANATFTIADPSIPASLSPYAGNNQSTPPGFPFSQPLVVRVANGAGGPVAGVVVTFDAPNSGASLVWAAPYTDPVTASTDSNGLASSPSLTANATGGTYLVTVTQIRVPNPTYFQLTNGGSAPGGGNNALIISEA
jgi:hypothetical protein